MASHLQNITVFGATGKAGSLITQKLVASSNPKFNVTAVVRPSSTSALPQSTNLKIVLGSPTDPAVLKEALTGADAVFLGLPATAPDSDYSSIIAAAGAAGVKWVIPSELGLDTANPTVTEQVIPNAKKPSHRKAIEVAGSSWVAVSTGLWLEMGVTLGFMGIDVNKRRYSVWTAADSKTDPSVNLTTIDTVTSSVVALLSLPIETLTRDFRNRFIYVRDWRVTHSQLVQAVREAVGLDGWTSEPEPVNVHDMAVKGAETLRRGDPSGTIPHVYGSAFDGEKSEFIGPLSNDALGLPRDGSRDFVAAIKAGLGMEVPFTRV